MHAQFVYNTLMPSHIEYLSQSTADLATLHDRRQGCGLRRCGTAMDCGIDRLLCLRACRTGTESWDREIETACFLTSPTWPTDWLSIDRITTPQNVPAHAVPRPAAVASTMQTLP